MLVTAFLFKFLSRSTLFHRHVRRFCADYGMPLALVASSATAYWGRFRTANPLTLPVGAAFQPAHGRSWLVHFWELDGKWVALALPFGFILWVLFFFDHNVSVRHTFLYHLCSFSHLMSTNGTVGLRVQSLISQGSQFPLRKPAGFHYDFALLGVTTFLAGLLGVPAPNGLIPQAPIHTSSLLVHGIVPKDDVLHDDDGRFHEVPIAVVEQRVSNLAQGSLCLVLLTGPFLHVLNLVPQGVWSGFRCAYGLHTRLPHRRACGLVVCCLPSALGLRDGHTDDYFWWDLVGTWVSMNSRGTALLEKSFTSSRTAR